MNLGFGGLKKFHFFKSTNSQYFLTTISGCPERTEISMGCPTKCHFSAKTLFQPGFQKIMVSNYVIQIFTFLGDPVSEPISAISSDLTTAAAATAAAGWWAA